MNCVLHCKLQLQMYAKYALDWYLCKTVFLVPRLVTRHLQERFHHFSQTPLCVMHRVQTGVGVTGSYWGHLDCQVLIGHHNINPALILQYTG